jgi:hypothetical protein
LAEFGSCSGLPTMHNVFWGLVAAAGAEELSIFVGEFYVIPGEVPMG